nr:hypothetical protein Iba_chr01cCG3480 [Ipomoea batatas]
MHSPWRRVVVLRQPTTYAAGLLVEKEKKWSSIFVVAVITYNESEENYEADLLAKVVGQQQGTTRVNQPSKELLRILNDDSLDIPMWMVSNGAY